MRNPNTEIEGLVIEKTLALLLKKNPDQISMREIASECNVTATLIYHYYKDKTQLFQAVALSCILKLNEHISNAAEQEKNPKKRVLAAAKAFRDWCFENPRKSLLVMQGIKSMEEGPKEYLEKYYACNRTGERLLREAVKSGMAKSKNIALDIGILISGLWGCCENVILKKTEEKYWEDGITFTDRFLRMWMQEIFC
ncbi:MAG: TetR/AcrR family transcriptional regulator [Treponema sp.]|nr:TetR/AcrR family transcriptional regulator [Treponema sp.]MBR4387458.1 TetR/AcrR family transcriptional regulator [Treponema sp.]